MFYSTCGFLKDSDSDDDDDDDDDDDVERHFARLEEATTKVT